MAVLVFRSIDVVKSMKFCAYFWCIVATIIGIFWGATTMIINVGLGVLIIILSPIAGFVGGAILGAVKAFIVNKALEWSEGFQINLDLEEVGIKKERIAKR